MAHLNGIFRLGRDAELRTTPSGMQILSLALVYNYGRKDESGQRPSQWVDASMFGQRGASLQPYLVKGSQIYADLTDVYVRTYEKKDGTPGVSLAGVIQDLEFCGGGQQGGQQSSPQRQASPRSAAPAPSGDDLNDDLPF